MVTTTIELTRERQDAVPAKTGKFELWKQCLASRPERGVGQGTFHLPLAGGSLGGLGSTLFYLGASSWLNATTPTFPFPPTSGKR